MNANVIPFNKNRIKINRLINKVASADNPLEAVFDLYDDIDGKSMLDKFSKDIGASSNVVDMITGGYMVTDDIGILELDNYQKWGNEHFVRALEWIRDNPNEDDYEAFIQLNSIS